MKKQNQKNHLMDSNSEIISRKSELLKKELRKYYEVQNMEGFRFCQCGSEKDAQMMCNLNPGFTYTIHFLPPTPKIVNVPHVRVEDDKQLMEQKILQQSDLQPLNL